MANPRSTQSRIRRDIHKARHATRSKRSRKHYHGSGNPFANDQETIVELSAALVQAPSEGENVSEQTAQCAAVQLLIPKMVRKEAERCAGALLRASVGLGYLRPVDAGRSYRITKKARREALDHLANLPAAA